ncbi:hypothetical protein HN51_030686 [Arachis hypogaea]
MMMVIVQIVLASVNVLYKLAINNHDMSEEQAKADLESCFHVILLWPVWVLKLTFGPSTLTSCIIMEVNPQIRKVY